MKKSRYQLVITNPGWKIGSRIVGASARVIDTATGGTVAGPYRKCYAEGAMRALRRLERAGGAA